MTVIHGDCLDVLRSMPDCSVDSVVTDPPYGLSFMGKRWDYDVPGEGIWRECLRVLKPGGHLLAFAGTRTQHRMAVRIEDAGFEIRDMIAWLYGSGFPKSHNLKDDWQGWGTALKPALEPITVARKPFPGTVAANVLAHGTGGLNVDGCRVSADGEVIEQSGELVDIDRGKCADGYDRPNATMFRTGKPKERGGPADAQGRWPANLIHDGGDEVVRLLNEAARFFYCAKASKRDRDEGCEGLNLLGRGRTCYDSQYHEGGGKLPPRTGNHHPTVKPTDLMRYLCRLVTPPGGIVLDPFAGSGSTGKAAALEGFQFIGIEREAEYVEIARARIAAVQPELFRESA
jgi:DNA modification methylase